MFVSVRLLEHTTRNEAKERGRVERKKHPPFIWSFDSILFLSCTFGYIHTKRIFFACAEKIRLSFWCTRANERTSKPTVTKYIANVGTSTIAMAISNRFLQFFRRETSVRTKNTYRLFRNPCSSRANRFYILGWNILHSHGNLRAQLLLPQQQINA